MNKLFLLFSHNLTYEQKTEAEYRFKIDEFIYLPEKLQYKWSNIPPEGEMEDNYLTEFKEFLLKNRDKENYVLIQGDFGVTYSMVNWCFKNGFIPIYSTTKRIYNSIQREDKSTTNIHVFKHVNYRLYKKEY